MGGARIGETRTAARTAATRAALASGLVVAALAPTAALAALTGRAPKAVDRGLARDPDARWATASDFANAILAATALGGILWMWILLQIGFMAGLKSPDGVIDAGDFEYILIALALIISALYVVRLKYFSK